MNHKNIIKLLKHVCEENQWKPFEKLLNNIKQLFPKFDPIYVLINSTSKDYYREKSKKGICICGRHNLLHVYVAEFDEEEYNLGSQCINSLEVLNILKEHTELLSLEELSQINRLKLFQKSMQRLHKKKCKSKDCHKKVDMKLNWEKEEIFKTYCSRCILDKSTVKCDICLEPAKFNSERSLCVRCDLRQNEKKYCNVEGCFTIVDIKYPFCYKHKNTGKKKCSYIFCQNMIDLKYKYCYEHRNISYF